MLNSKTLLFSGILNTRMGLFEKINENCQNKRPRAAVSYLNRKHAIDHCMPSDPVSLISKEATLEENNMLPLGEKSFL